jgi:hypothetical protein
MSEAQHIERGCGGGERAHADHSATALFTTTCDWRVSDLVTVFSIGIVMLGLAAAVF